MSDVWDGAEPFVMVGEMRTCNGITVAGGAVQHSGPCPVHGETLDSLRVEVATLTAERDQLRGERDDLRGGLTAAAENVCARRNELDIVEAERDALAARLAQAERVVEAARGARTVLKSWYHDPDCSLGRRELQHFEGEKVCAHLDKRLRHQCAEALEPLTAAVDALDGTAGPGEEGSGDGR